MAKANKAVAVAATESATTEVAVEIKFPTTDEMIASGLTTKSARIRHLYSLGMKTGAIAKQETGGLYQHAYNVINKPLKRVESVVPAAVEPKSEVETEVEAQPEEA